MKKTHFEITTADNKILAADADNAGRFIAWTEQNDVIAHDFRTKIVRDRTQLLLDFPFPKIRRLPGSRFLIVNSRGVGRHYVNAHVFLANGRECASFPIGDCVRDVFIWRDRIIATYFERGESGGTRDGIRDGIAMFDFDGKPLFSYNARAGNDRKTITDCYGACFGEADILTFLPCASWLLTEWNCGDFREKTIPVPQRMHGADAISPAANAVLFHSPYHDRGKFFRWNRHSEEAEEIPELVPPPVKGLGDGNFLRVDKQGYTIIDPSALSIKRMFRIGNCRLEFVLDDIANMEADALVNAANSELAGGFGVDGAIHRRGGPAIMAETRRNFPLGCVTGDAVPSGAGDLKAKFVFHAVGPRWGFESQNEAALLRAVYERCLQLAVTHDCRSIVFPSISTGDFGYPVEPAAAIAVQTVRDFLQSLHANDAATSLQWVRFCLFSQHDLDCYIAAAEKLFNEGEQSWTS